MSSCVEYSQELFTPPRPQYLVSATDSRIEESPWNRGQGNVDIVLEENSHSEKPV